MPTITVYRHGVSAGMGNQSAVPPERTHVRGWSAHAIRRNQQFLYSIDENGLADLSGLSLTLTVRDCPDTAQEWCRARDNWLRQLRRTNPVCVHWVTEWQRRGVPHIHLAIYWPLDTPTPPDLPALIEHWLSLTARWRPDGIGQHSRRIYDVLGWNQYVSKHAARGLRHYQRSPDGVPQGWRGASTGRMWGKLGKWPVTPPVPLQGGSRSFYAFRRVARAWRLSHARASGNPARIRSARQMLRCPDKNRSAVRGFSEWMPAAVTLQYLRTVPDLISI